MQGYAEALRRAADALDRQSPVEALDPVDMQALTALTIAWFGARYDHGQPATVTPPQVDAPTTAAMVTASAILKGCEVELFELGMWQTFSGQT